MRLAALALCALVAAPLSPLMAQGGPLDNFDMGQFIQDAQQPAPAQPAGQFGGPLDNLNMGQFIQDAQQLAPAQPTGQFGGPLDNFSMGQFIQDAQQLAPAAPLGQGGNALNGLDIGQMIGEVNQQAAILNPGYQPVQPGQFDMYNPWAGGFGNYVGQMQAWAQAAMPDLLAAPQNGTQMQGYMSAMWGLLNSDMNILLHGTDAQKQGLTKQLQKSNDLTGMQQAADDHWHNVVNGAGQSGFFGDPPH